MREDISRSIIQKTSELIQNEANNSNPSLSLVVARKETLLDDFDFVERRRIRRTTKNTITDVGIAVSHPRLNKGEKTVYIAYVRSGKVYVRKSTVIAQTSETDWETVDIGAPSAEKCDIAFPATIEENARGIDEYITTAYPFIFYVASGTVKCLDLATMTTTSIVMGVTDISARMTPHGLALFYLISGNIFYKLYDGSEWGSITAVNKSLTGIKSISTVNTLDGFGIQGFTGSKLHRLIGEVSGGSFSWGNWDDTAAALDASGTGAFIEFYDEKRQALYDNNGFTYCIENDSWFPHAETEIYDRKYSLIEFDHTNYGTVYFATVYHGKTYDIVYFLRYVYAKDVSEYTANVTKILQVDNPISQINAEIKNIDDALFASEATMFAPSSVMHLGVRYGNSEVVDLGTGYIDQATFSYGGTSVSLSGRNRTGIYLNDQTFDGDWEDYGVPSLIVENIMVKFGLGSYYECDTSADGTSGNWNYITLKVETKTTAMQALESLNEILTNDTDGKQWKFEELPDGTIIVGYDEFRSQYAPKGNYIFDGWNDVFAISVDRCIDGVYNKVRCTGTTLKGKEISYTYSVKNFKHWDVDENRIYHADHIDGITKSALKAYAKALAKQLKYIGRIITYRTNLKPQLIIGDVARITYGQDEDETKKMGAITEITHTMGNGGYFTEFTVTSGGNVTEVSVPTPTRSGNSNNSTIVYTADKSAKGTNRKKRLNDYLGVAVGGSISMAMSKVSVEGETLNFPEVIRNIGFRLLDEPNNVKIQYDAANNQVKLKWGDPDDITTYEPVPVEWAGTVIVRSEDGAPLHPWDGTLIDDITDRDEYKNQWYVDDNNIKKANLYFYGIFPYHIALDDEDHPIKYYRYTKVVQIITGEDLEPAVITKAEADGTSVTITFTIPTLANGSYDSIILVAKKNGTPLAADDGDDFITLSSSQTSATFSGLDEESHYYFVIFLEDDQGNTASSDPAEAHTGVEQGWDFSYTGSIQTFTAPKTGIYSLETWGAQGGDATDGTNTARGGYGAYAYGEVLLQAGETIYINVGGQNGYGGGGNYVAPNNNS